MKLIMIIIWIVIGTISLGILISSVIKGDINMIRVSLPIFVIAILTLIGYIIDD